MADRETPGDPKAGESAESAVRDQGAPGDREARHRMETAGRHMPRGVGPGRMALGMELGSSS